MLYGYASVNLITIAVSHGRIISVEGQSFANDGKEHGAFAGTNPRLLSWTTSTSSTLRRSTLMLPTIAVWGHVLDIGLVLLLAYLVVLWLASWVLESLRAATSTAPNGMPIRGSPTMSNLTVTSVRRASY